MIIKKLQAMKAKKGFTLVELIVVIAIIGVLAAILIPLLMNHVTNSRIQSADSDAANIFRLATAAMSRADSRNMANDDIAGYIRVSVNADMPAGVRWAVFAPGTAATAAADGVPEGAITHAVVNLNIDGEPDAIPIGVNNATPPVAQANAVDLERRPRNAIFGYYGPRVPVGNAVHAANGTNSVLIVNGTTVPAQVIDPT